MSKCWTGILFVLVAGSLAPPACATEEEDYQSALSAYQQGQYTQAVQSFAKVLQEDPNSWQAYQGMGSSMLQQGDRAGALQAYQKSLALHPDNPAIQAEVDRLSGKPAAPSAANPGAQPTPKWSPILLQQSGSDKIGYYYQGAPLDRYEQFKDVTGPLHDEEIDRLLEESHNEETTGLACMIGGGALVAGGIIYYVAAQPTTQIVSGFIAYDKITPADLTPSLILAGAGIVAGIVGGFWDGDSKQKKSDAVDRYDHLIGQDQKPVYPASSPGGSVSPEEAHWGITPVPSAPATGAPAAATPGAQAPQIGFGVAPVVDIPFSGKTASEYVPGGGVGINFNYVLNRNFSLALNAGLVSLPVNQSSAANSFQQTYGTPLPAGVSISGGWSYIPVTAQIQFSLPVGKTGLSPYVFWGGGVAFNSVNGSVNAGAQSVSAVTGETDLLMTQGLGLSFRPDPNFEIFTELRLDVDFTTQKGTDTYTLTTNSGTYLEKGNLSDDGPTYFMPIELGVRFWQ